MICVIKQHAFSFGLNNTHVLFNSRCLLEKAGVYKPVCVQIHACPQTRLNKGNRSNGTTFPRHHFFRKIRKKMRLRCCDSG
jgi:hypothetical protein